MRRLFFEEHEEFLLSFIPGHTCVEVAEEFSKKYFPVTPKQIHDFKCNRKIRSGTKCGKPKNCGYLFPKEIREFIFANNKGKTLSEITALVNEKFGKTFTKKQLRCFRKNNHLVSGLSGRFGKGNVPLNKGKKGLRIPGSEKGWFKKGGRPYNYMQVGSEATTPNGYIKVKVAEPNKWKLKHVLEWEKHHGKVPKNHCIMFKDGNRTNCHISNLVMITRAENSIMNHQSLRSDNSDVTMTGLQLARLQQKISEIKRKRKHGGEKK